VITDGYDNHQILDVLGRGSIMGANIVLREEKWPYSCINNAFQTAKIIHISTNTINYLKKNDESILKVITAQEEYFEIYGLPQIDYTIQMNVASVNEMQE